MTFYFASYILFAFADTVGAATLAGARQTSQNMHDAFDEFVANHGRDYSPHEFEMRRELFHSRWKAIQKFNDQPNRLWTAGINEFADRTEAERKGMLGYDSTVRKMLSRGTHKSHSLLQVQDATQIPEEVNWKNLSVSSNVRSQGMCGSCWAFTVIAVMEAHYEIHTAKGGAVRKFSPQQVVSCSPNPHSCGGSGGCDGATVELGMDWILKNGLASEDEVPYLANTGTCKRGSHQDGSGKKGDAVLAAGDTSTQTGSAIGMVGYTTLPSNEDLPLAKAIATYGPVGVAVAANEWFAYNSGIFNGCSPGGVLNHAVTAYGYGQENGNKYWLIRNSYGSSWGEHGFIRLQRFGDAPKSQQHCGMDNDPMEGVMCKGSKVNAVEVCGMCGVLYDATVPYFQGSPEPHLPGVAEPSVQAYGIQSSDEGSHSDTKQLIETDKRQLQIMRTLKH